VKRFRWVGLLGLLLPLVLAAAAPDLALRDVDGKSHPVREYIGRGQWTVVALWSVDCVICQRELPEVAFFHDAHKDKDARVLGVSVDGYAERARVRGFIDHHGLGFPNLLGERADVAGFGGGALRGTPTYLIFTPDGRLAARHVGASQPDFLDRELARLKAQQEQSPR
jgi:thiol-disulfide isomerase/thioredoxin